MRRERVCSGLPPLENGDALTAGEFLRRYEAMPELKKAELIEGVVYMGSPVRLAHAEPDTLIERQAARVLEVLRAGLESSEHREFVMRLGSGK